MAVLKDWILTEAGDENVIGVVLGPISEYQMEKCPHIPLNYPKNQVLSWEEALPWIEYEFYDGWGLEECFPLFAWTENKVIAISCYDGSTSVFSVPRNPCDIEPFMPGGG
jgi:hypothetical protein